MTKTSFHLRHWTDRELVEWALGALRSPDKYHQYPALELIEDLKARMDYCDERNKSTEDSGKTNSPA